MEWRVSGADRQTGEDKEVIVTAVDKVEAERLANIAGVLIDSVVPIEPTHESGNILISARNLFRKRSVALVVTSVMVGVRGVALLGGFITWISHNEWFLLVLFGAAFLFFNLDLSSKPKSN